MYYDGVIEKPDLSEETLMHFGVKGMKWGIRHDPERKGISGKKKDISRKKKYRAVPGGFTRNSAYRMASSMRGIAENWGNSAERGKKLVKEGNSQDYGYFDKKKDVGYIKALLRGGARSVQLGIAATPVYLLAGGVKIKHPLVGDVIQNITRKAVAAGTVANAAKTIMDISNTRDVRNYNKQTKKANRLKNG